MWATDGVVKQTENQQTRKRPSSVSGLSGLLILNLSMLKKSYFSLKFLSFKAQGVTGDVFLSVSSYNRPILTYEYQLPSYTDQSILRSW
jgi:hypothetical protein